MFILHIFPALFITLNFSYKQKDDGCAWTGNMRKGIHNSSEILTKKKLTEVPKIQLRSNHHS